MVAVIDVCGRSGWGLPFVSMSRGDVSVSPSIDQHQTGVACKKRNFGERLEYHRHCCSAQTDKLKN